MEDKNPKRYKSISISQAHVKERVVSEAHQGYRPSQNAKHFPGQVSWEQVKLTFLPGRSV